MAVELKPNRDEVLAGKSCGLRRACVATLLGEQIARFAIMAKPNKPGTPAPASGQYKPSTGGTEITAIQGKPLPPTPKSGQTWKLVDPTKHKN